MLIQQLFDNILIVLRIIIIRNIYFNKFKKILFSLILGLVNTRPDWLSGMI